jgi:hypothetical protein
VSLDRDQIRAAVERAATVQHPIEPLVVNRIVHEVELVVDVVVEQAIQDAETRRRMTAADLADRLDRTV